MSNCHCIFLLAINLKKIVRLFCEIILLAGCGTIFLLVFYKLRQRIAFHRIFCYCGCFYFPMGHGLLTLFVKMTLKSKQKPCMWAGWVSEWVFALQSRNIKVKFYDSNHFAHLVLNVSNKTRCAHSEARSSNRLTRCCTADIAKCFNEDKRIAVLLQQ